MVVIPTKEEHIEGSCSLEEDNVYPGAFSISDDDKMAGRECLHG